MVSQDPAPLQTGKGQLMRAPPAEVWLTHTPHGLRGGTQSHSQHPTVRKQNCKFLPVEGCQGWGSGGASGVRAQGRPNQPGPEDQQVQASTVATVSLGAGNTDPTQTTHGHACSELWLPRRGPKTESREPVFGEHFLWTLVHERL